MTADTHTSHKTHTADITLTTAQIESAHTDGFLIVKNVCPEEELQRIRGTYDYLFENQIGKAQGDYYDLGGSDEDGKQRVLPQLMNPLQYMEWLHDSQYTANCKAIAKALLQTEKSIIDLGSHAILKPGSYGLVTPWHQDKAYWAYGYEHFNVNFWMPLEDVTVESGCLQYIPGSHRFTGQNGFDVLEHQSINNDPRIHGLELTAHGFSAIDLTSAVAAPCSAGDVVIHFPYTLHYANANSSEHDRRALITGHGLATLETDDAIGEYPWIQAKETLREKRSLESQE